MTHDDQIDAARMSEQITAELGSQALMPVKVLETGFELELERPAQPLLVVRVFADVEERGTVSRWSGPAAVTELHEMLREDSLLHALAERVESAQDLEETLIDDLGISETPHAYHAAPFAVVISSALSAELAQNGVHIDAQALTTLVAARR